MVYFLLKFSGTKEDIHRQIIKSDICVLSIPEIELEISEGNGRFITIEDLLKETYDNLKKYSSNYQSSINKNNPTLKTLSKIQSILDGDTDFTLVLNDPLGLSQIELFENDTFEKLHVELIERNHLENSNFNISDD
jgi:zinc finger protein